MQTKIFDGKAWVAAEQELLRDKIRELRDFGVYPSLVSILIGDNPASKLYISLKQKAAQELGIKFTVRFFDENTSVASIKKFIQKQNEDNNVHGIMVQMPLPSVLTDFREDIIRAIAINKDVDGLRAKSNFIHPTVKAILDILEILVTNRSDDKIVVLGSKGMVGSKLVVELKKQKFNFVGLDQDVQNLSRFTQKADIIVSATGQQGLIKGNMVKEGVAIIDVGAPKAEVEESVYGKAKFLTPVPGGIGPMTVSHLMQNLILAAGASFDIPA